MGPICTLRFCFFKGSKRGLNMDPDFYVFSGPKLDPKWTQHGPKKVFKRRLVLGIFADLGLSLESVLFQLPVLNSIQALKGKPKRVGRRCQAAWPFG